MDHPSRGLEDPSALVTSSAVLASLWAPLRSWYERCQRPLPWRAAHPDPYQVWVSEVMSQQTTMTVVQRYFQRFVAELPDLPSLAGAQEEQLRRLWAGLGYYSRAARLHQGAQHILNNLEGRFPDSYSRWLEIPGCGPYTAAAVASICFEERVAVVDGNVVRVMARLLAWSGDVHGGSFKRQLQDRLSASLPAKSPGLFNQALMELGALVCTPKKPRCLECPLQSFCKAYQADTVATIPSPKNRKPTQNVQAVALVVQDAVSGRLALFRRPRGLLSGSVGFPLVGGQVLQGVEQDHELHFLPQTISHAITHHRIKLRVAEVQLQAGGALGYQNDGSGPFATDWASVSWLEEPKVFGALSSSLDQKVWQAVVGRKL